MLIHMAGSNGIADSIREEDAMMMRDRLTDSIRQQDQLVDGETSY